MDPNAHDQLLEIVRSVRRRWRMKLALRGVRRSPRAARRPRSIVSALGPAVDAVHAGVHPLLPDRASACCRRGAGLLCCWRGRCCAASPTSRSRCISRSTSRRSRPRSSARSRAARAGRARGAAVAGAGPQAGRERGREVPRARRRPARRAAARAPLLRRARRRARDRRRAISCSGRPTCAMRCRRCSSSRAASKPPRRTASR